MEYEGVILTYISIQGDLDGWMNLNDPLDDTLTYNQTGLVRTTEYISPSKLIFITGTNDGSEERQHLGRISDTL